MARHGVPAVVISDNGPQFSAAEFKRFSNSYGFEHKTSSPHFPQSNGEAERAVKTIKQLLQKAEDPYLALLAYRTTPLQNGYSPAELLMNRRLRSTLPTIPALLQPSIPDTAVLTQRVMAYREKQKEQFDRRHRANSLDPLEPGDTVWIPDRGASGVVVDQAAPRSYNVETSSGELRRNRRHLNSMTNPGSSDEANTDGGILVPTPKIVCLLLCKVKQRLPHQHRLTQIH